MFLPVRAGCPNSAYDPSGRIWNSRGCPSHRQPFLCLQNCALRRALDLRRICAYSRASTMQTSPYFTIQQIAEGIRSKEVSPVEIIEAHLKRIDSCESKINAFVHLER